MGSQPPDLESRFEELSRRLATVEQRLGRLEGRGIAPSRAADRDAEEPPDAPVERVISLEGFSLALVGRLFLILAGAFALRALTESGAFPQIIGTALGFAYAVLWLLLAGRAAGAGHSMSATFHGVASAIIGFPLLWESTVRFKIISVELGAVALGAFTALSLVIALRHRLRQLAIVFTLAAAGTALGFAVATKMLIPFAGFLLLLGVATMWLDYACRWTGPGLLSAIVIDSFVALMTLMVLVGKHDQVVRIFDPALLVLLQLALMLLYIGSFGIRTLTRGRDLHVSEIVHGVAVLLIGLGGAVTVNHAVGLSGVGLGLVSLVLAVGCYGVSFAVIDRHLGSRVNFIFYSTLALIYTLVAIEELLSGPARSIAFSVVALVVAWLGARRERVTLSQHATVYVIAAAVTSGLAAGSIGAFAGQTLEGAGWINAAALIALAVAIVSAWFPVAAQGKTWGRLSHAPKLLLLAVAALGLAGVVVSLLEAALFGTGEATHPGALAALRTAVLALLAVGLAAAGRSARFAEAGWLVYPVLVVGGLKLLVEDARAMQASSLFVSLAFYGGALIVAPWITRRGRGEQPAD